MTFGLPDVVPIAVCETVHVPTIWPCNLEACGTNNGADVDHPDRGPVWDFPHFLQENSLTVHRLRQGRVFADLFQFIIALSSSAADSTVK
jgi:hypothetical protein